MRARALSKAFHTCRFIHICSVGQKERTESAGLNRWFCSLHIAVDLSLATVIVSSTCSIVVSLAFFRYSRTLCVGSPQHAERSEQQPPDTHRVAVASQSKALGS